MHVMTWNMQGAQGSYQEGGGKRKQLEGTNIADAIGFLANGKVSVLALQETGGPPVDWDLNPAVIGGFNLMTGVVQLGTERRPKGAFVVWYDSMANTTASHDRCSMAVLSTNFSGTVATARADAISGPSANLRPLVGLKTADDIWVYSIHAPSGNHNAAAGVAESQLNSIDPNRDYICMGDYNCPPWMMRGRGFQVCATKLATQQAGNTLDYAVYSGIQVRLDNTTSLTSDHYSQTFAIS